MDAESLEIRSYAKNRAGLDGKIALSDGASRRQPWRTRAELREDEADSETKTQRRTHLAARQGTDARAGEAGLS